jgi:tropomodulin
MSYERDLSDADFNEINELLMKLTPEELEQLNSEVDPDDQYLPAHQRCKEQTKKAPTGKFDRMKLINFLEEQAKNEKDWDTKPYVKETKGKVYQPPEPQPQTKEAQEEIDAISTEWDELLANASEAEIVELAAILGFTGLVNQVQFHSANSMDSQSLVSTIGGWNAAAKAEQLKFIPPEPDNVTDVDESLRRISNNDSSLSQLNLNNIKVSSPFKARRSSPLS